MSDITVKIDDKGLLNLINLMKKKALNMATPFKKASLIMHADVMKRFEGESDEKGTHWRPIMLTKQTMKRRKMLTKRGTVKKGRTSLKILQDTGRLKNSIRPYSNAFGAEVKTNVEYAAAHNYGDKKRKLPARPFMRDLSEEATGKIIRLFQIHLFNNRD